jgi:hypothetical protein
MGRRARADPGAIQRVPLTARAQHEKDRVHRGAIRHSRSVTPQRMLRPMLWQYRFDLCPKHVRNPPAVVLRNESHAPAHATPWLPWKTSLHQMVGNGPTWISRIAAYWDRLLEGVQRQSRPIVA